MCKFKFAYETGISIETAPQHVFGGTEKVVEHTEIPPGAFLDIECAFSRTSFFSTKAAALDDGIEPMLCERIY
jgi:hypothetical protein